MPIVKECKMIKNDEKNIEEHMNKMQALNLAAKNDTSHIRTLSQIM